VQGGGVTTTIYVGRHFEVRDHDQPTKYVFDGSTRVAEITGSLSSNLRVQRLRLYSGWNLCSLAVSGPFPATGAEAISTAYQWNSGTGDYSRITLGQSLAAGTVLWIKAGTNADVSVLGTYSNPSPQPVQPGGAYFPGAGLEAWSPGLPGLASSWGFDALSGEWLSHVAGDLASVSGPPPTLSPGQAFFLQSAAAASLEIPDPTLRIRYYHEDHLGSSSVITDASGALVEETAFYPFGTPRNEDKPRQIHEPYQFTQKERDLESGLHDFGKRFYSSTLGRWLSTDPLEEKGGSLNLYAYARQDPLRYQDADGMEVTLAKSYDKKSGVTTYTMHLEGVVVSDAKKSTITRDQLEGFKERLAEQIKNSYQGQEGKIRWQTTVDLTVVDKIPSPDSKAHVFKIVDVAAHGPSKAGDAALFGRTMNIDTKTFFGERPGSNASELERSAYISAENVGAHELGHVLGLNDIDMPTGREDRNNLMSHQRLYDRAAIRTDQLKGIVNDINAKHVNLSDADAAKRGR
jgi:RHS repeat-associated protein